VSAQYPWERALGARPRADGQTEFRVWAPRAHTVSLALDGSELPLREAGFGVHEALVAARPGDDYWFVLDGEDFVFTTGADTVKGHGLRRDPRLCIAIDDPLPPFAFVMVEGIGRRELEAILRRVEDLLTPARGLARTESAVYDLAYLLTRTTTGQEGEGANGAEPVAE